MTLKQIKYKPMKSLCYIREVYQAITDFESYYQQSYKLNLHEITVLGFLYEEKLNSGQLSKELKLSPSNTSKIIRSLESKGFIERIVGEKDRRQMYFRLTSKGIDRVNIVSCNKEDMPATLRILIEHFENQEV